MEVDTYRTYLRLARPTLHRQGFIYADDTFVLERRWNIDEDDYFWIIRTKEGVTIDTAHHYFQLTAAYGISLER